MLLIFLLLVDIILPIAATCMAAVGTMAEVQENLCERASQTWSGKCGNTDHCNNQCKQWEDARSGACHKRGGNWKCFCYFNCPLDKHN
ncbi:hypothetical protein Pint_34717 [Pistacia integerrima]|uniref:Uncharacterized protein n=1 Tax=Pistacia integerrima TaxID=434235 RepID=A0ACC0X8A9_9ROSI|nr:hypothetical protein Pint_34717 [Pistacia integerrima]